MSTSVLTSTRLLRTLWIVGALALAFCGVYFLWLDGRGTRREDDFMPVGITGAQHIGRNFSVSDFYVDGYNGSNVGREGGGGSNVCCVLLPMKWRPGLSVDLRWEVANWTNEKPEEIKAGDYQSVTWEFFKARVPVEKYNSPENLYVHFFAHGKARVVSSGPGSESTLHPILRNDPHAADSATAGVLVNELFTKAELDEMRRQDDEFRKKHGDWR